MSQIASFGAKATAPGVSVHSGSTLRVPINKPSVKALYIHVPFCAKKCAYCDFLSWPTSASDPCLDSYVEATVRELHALHDRGLLEGCRTAYIGGGTPTLLSGSRLGMLAGCVRGVAPSLTEFTCEANPDSLTDDVLTAMVASGVSRISVGVQSLNDAELMELGRVHTAEQAKERVAAAVSAGLDVSVDLMCAIPRQSDVSWAASLRGVIDLGVCHISVYPLTIEEGTPLYRRFEHDTCEWNDEDVQARRMEMAEQVLTACGFVRYEVASYARSGKRCEHNIAYWTGVPYLGVGKGAASMLGPAEYDLAQQVLEWLPSRRPGASRMRFTAYDGDVEFLTSREAWAEDLMLGMRMTDGIETRLLDGEPSVRAELICRGLVEERGNRLVPTHEGWLLGNELYGALWALAEP